MTLTEQEQIIEVFKNPPEPEEEFSAERFLEDLQRRILSDENQLFIEMSNYKRDTDWAHLSNQIVGHEEFED